MKISLITPVLNEQDTIGVFYNAVRSCEYLQNIETEIIFINDGSTDNTEQIILQLQASDPLINLISFTRNFGKEAALMAGIQAASGDAIIPIDVDLQDPIEVIPKLITKLQDGYDIVLAKRINRDQDSFLKRKTAQLFYIFYNAISPIKIEQNVGDFRVISKEYVEKIKLLPEYNLFMKGVLSWVGGKVSIIEYERAPRITGKSKFNGLKLLNFALDGITSFSTLPLRVWTYVGCFISLTSFIFATFIIIKKIIFGDPVAGYTSLSIFILFLGGIQLIGIGILGEYVGRIYLETKNRPRYLTK